LHPRATFIVAIFRINRDLGNKQVPWSNAAVLAADVAGYSRLTGADEAGEVIKPGEQRHAVAAAAGRHVP
jgi:class 3 adenylate cyclase